MGRIAFSAALTFVILHKGHPMGTFMFPLEEAVSAYWTHMELQKEDAAGRKGKGA